MTLQTFVSIAGWLAALLILGAYSLLSFGKILPSSWVYQLMNIVGAAGFIITTNHYHAISNAYNQATANWYVQAQTNPNTPMPAPPKEGTLSPLVYVGLASIFTCIIPIAGSRRHTQKAIDIYNGAN